MRVGGYVAGTLVSVFSAALLFRHLGVGDTGLYITALSLVAIVAAFSDLGLTAVGVRELSRRPPDERWPLARDLLGLRMTLTAVGGVVVTAIAAGPALLADARGRRRPGLCRPVAAGHAGQLAASAGSRAAARVGLGA